MQRLQPAFIIDTRPGYHRPAVIELPVYGSHAAAAVAPEMLHPITDGIRLQQLGGINEGVKAGRIFISLLHVPHNFTVGAVLALMLLANIGKCIIILRIIGKGFYRLQGRERLEAKLGGIPEEVLPVF